MNNLIRIIFILLVLLFLGCSSSDEIHSSYSFEPGAEVYIEMNDNEKYEGELLRVDDGTMILCEVYNATEQELMDSVYTIYTLMNRDIIKIEIMEDGNPIYGIFLGASVGAMVGVAVAKHNSSGIGIISPILPGCCIGGLIGASVGGIIAFVLPNDEIVYEQTDTELYDFKQLNVYSRHGRNNSVILE